MIKQWLEDRKSRRAERAAAKERELQAEKADVEVEVAEMTEKMLKSPCAVNGMRACDSACVHFRRGYAFTFPDLRTGELRYFAESPGCKLWR